MWGIRRPKSGNCKVLGHSKWKDKVTSYKMEKAVGAGGRFGG